MLAPVTHKIESAFRAHGLDPSAHYHLVVALMNIVYDRCEEELNWAFSSRMTDMKERMSDLIDQADFLLDK